MLRLTREIRIAAGADYSAQRADAPTNSFGGFPTLTGLTPYYALRVTLAGEVQPDSSYLRNIKNVDRVVRRQAVPVIDAQVARQRGGDLMRVLFELLKDQWPGATLDSVSLGISPTVWLTQIAAEFPMSQRLSQSFEFCAAHRLHNPALSDEENRRIFGKCNNPNWHGHNYQLQVTLAGSAERTTGMLASLVDLERIVTQNIIDRFDHMNLNTETDEFRDTIPTVENIARVIYDLLKPKLTQPASRLASVTVWESPRTWCEYSER
jgi:6-pyruvoyltetrahydropterin/6-carboxytetrahydropterin synthase